MIELYKILTLPQGYQRMPLLEDDPEGSVNYTASTPAAQCFVQAYPVSADEFASQGHSRELIDRLHDSLGEQQALIEVEDGTNSNGMPYVYSIVKSRKEDEGMQYTLMFYGRCGSDAFCVHAFFVEQGETGRREKAVWNYLRDRGVVSDSDRSKWERDPYDRSLTGPFLMNLSERADFDEAFPDHPLSMCRALVRFWKGDSEDFF